MERKRRREKLGNQKHSRGGENTLVSKYVQYYIVLPKKLKDSTGLVTNSVTLK